MKQPLEFTHVKTSTSLLCVSSDEINQSCEVFSLENVEIQLPTNCMLSVLVRKFPSLFVYTHITFKMQLYFLLQYFQLITDLENKILSLCYQHRKPYSLLGDREDRAQLFSIVCRVT